MARKKVEIRITKASNGMKVGQLFNVSSYTAQVAVKNGEAELTSEPKKAAAKKPAAKKKTDKTVNKEEAKTEE